MNYLLSISAVLFLFACGNSSDKKDIEGEHKKAKHILLEDEAFDPNLEEDEDEFEQKRGSDNFSEKDTSHQGDHHEYVANYYVLIADTGLNYFELRTKMFELSKAFNLPIDTLEREYNKEKDLIALPIDDQDPVYAGEYFQRRFPSNNFSLEYVNAYQQNTLEKNIGIVAGIFEKETDALKFLEKIKTLAPACFMVKAQVYIGCIH